MVNVTEASASETLKESSLEAIGYICQDIVSGFFYFDLSDHIIFFVVCDVLVCIEDKGRKQRYYANEAK